MLSAILHGKKRGSGLEGINLHLLEGSEDILTATVFERLSYLPNDIFQKFIQNLLGEEIQFSSLAKIDFWVSWYNNGARVEPDVVLRDVDGQVIIVEAKRYDNVQQQYTQQLSNEIQAAKNEGILNPIILAIGGMSSENRIQEELEKEIMQSSKLKKQLYFCSWKDVYLALKKVIDRKSHSQMRLLSDIEATYHWHNIRYLPYQWLGKLKKISIKENSLPSLKFRKKLRRLENVKIKITNFPSFIGNFNE